MGLQDMEESTSNTSYFQQKCSIDQNMGEDGIGVTEIYFINRTVVMYKNYKSIYG